MKILHSAPIVFCLISLLSTAPAIAVPNERTTTSMSKLETEDFLSCAGEPDRALRLNCFDNLAESISPQDDFRAMPRSDTFRPNTEPVLLPGQWKLETFSGVLAKSPEAALTVQASDIIEDRFGNERTLELQIGCRAGERYVGIETGVFLPRNNESDVQYSFGDGARQGVATQVAPNNPNLALFIDLEDDFIHQLGRHKELTLYVRRPRSENFEVSFPLDGFVDRIQELDKICLGVVSQVYRNGKTL